jgi:cell division protein FtsZ
MGMAMMGTGHASGPNRAREAAEAAIRSPLLEDVNLMGARGILVNITAGPDLSLGEFSEVGNTVEEFASDTATVVVGTVIDPELRDELRVTVVATGLGAKTDKPVKVVDNTTASAAPSRQQPAESSTPNYRDLDRPTVMRNTGQGNSAAAARLNQPAEDLDYLDIPAFLRRQAD